MTQLNGNDLNLNQAIIKGKMEQKVDTARQMLSNGASIQSVVSATGLHSDAVNKLNNQTGSQLSASSASTNSFGNTSSNDVSNNSSAAVFDSGSGTSNGYF